MELELYSEFRKMRVLIVLPSLDGGGIDRIMYNYALTLVGKVHIDFLVFSKNTGMLEEMLRAKGCQVYHCPPLRDRIVNNIKFQLSVMREIDYDIVHVNSYAGTVSLICALIAGVKGRICHAHTFYPRISRIKNLLVRGVIAFDKLLANGLYACSKQVADWTWRYTCIKTRHIVIIPNAIELGKYKFSIEKREQVRHQLGIESSAFVIGQVARFSSEKNHEYTIKVFEVLSRKNPKSRLILVGKGPLESSIRQQVELHGITDKVLFLGNRDDVHDLLSAFDVFVLTSVYEGLPVTLIEAQANDLPVLCSSSVHEEVAITNKVEFISLDSDPELWATKLLSIGVRNQTNDSQYQVIRNAGYDVEIASNMLKENWQVLMNNERDSSNEIT